MVSPWSLSSSKHLSVEIFDYTLPNRRNFFSTPVHSENNTLETAYSTAQLSKSEHMTFVSMFPTKIQSQNILTLFCHACLVQFTMRFAPKDLQNVEIQKRRINERLLFDVFEGLVYCYSYFGSLKPSKCLIHYEKNCQGCRL